MDSYRPLSRMTTAAEWPARHPWTTLLIALVLVLGSLYRLGQVTVNSSVAAMLDKNDPSTVALARVLDHFNAVDDLLVLVTLPDDPGRGHAQGVKMLLEFADRFETLAKGSELIVRVNHKPEPQWREFVQKQMVPAGVFYLSDEQFKEFQRRLTVEGLKEQIAANEAFAAAPGPEAGALSEVLLKDPLRFRDFLTPHLATLRGGFKTYQGGEDFISPDGKHLLLIVRGHGVPDDLEFSKKLTEKVRQLAGQATTEGLRVDMGGSYAIAAYSEQSIRSDMIINVNTSIAMILILFLMGFRGLWSFPLAMVPTVVGIIVGFGAFALFSTSLTPLTAAIGGILAGLGIDYSILFLSRYRIHRARGMLPSGSNRSTLEEVGPALVFGCLTSIAGFVTISLSHVQALKDFAGVGALGLVGALVGSVTLLPAMLRLMDRHAGVENPVPTRPDYGRFYRAILRWLDRNARRMSILGLVVFCGLLGMVVEAAVDRSWFETDVHVLHPHPNPAIDTMDRITEAFGLSPSVLIIHLESDSSAGLLLLAHEVDQRLKQQSDRLTSRSPTLSLATLLPDPRVAPARSAALKAMKVDEVLARFDEAIKQSAFEGADYGDFRNLLRKMLTATPPSVEDLTTYQPLKDRLLPKDAGFPMVGPTIEAISLVHIAEPLDDQVRREQVIGSIRAAIADLPGANLTGMDVVGLETERAVRRDLGVFFTLSAGLIVLGLLVYFRSLVKTVFALLPVCFGMAAMVAWITWSGDRFNLANLLAVPLLLGCGVDYGIFLVTLACAPRREGDPELIEQLQSTCHAVVMANMTSVLGFGSLIFTATPAIQSLGRAAGIGMLSTLGATLLVLVPVLLWHRRGWESEATGP